MLPWSHVKEIPLTQGGVALVDDEDYEALAAHRWCFGAKRYAVRRVPGGTVYMHRAITGAGSGQVVDHANRDTLNNTRANLRVCTQGQNLQNQAISPSRKWGKRPSRYKGVSWVSHVKSVPWKARIKQAGKYVELGHFATEEEAAHAYDLAALRLFGEFARPNFEPVGAA